MQKSSTASAAGKPNHHNVQPRRQSGAEEEEVLAIKALGLNTGGFSEAANSAEDLLCS